MVRGQRAQPGVVYGFTDREVVDALPSVFRGADEVMNLIVEKTPDPGRAQSGGMSAPGEQLAL